MPRLRITLGRSTVVVAVVAGLLGGELSRRRRALRFEAAAVRWACVEKRSKLLRDTAKIIADSEQKSQQVNERMARLYRDIASGRDSIQDKRSQKAEVLEREAASSSAEASLMRREEKREQALSDRAGMLVRKYQFAARFPL